MARLEIVRRQKMLTQRDLAEKAGVAKSTIFLIEAGRTTPRFGVIRKLSEALGVDPAEVDEFRQALGLEGEEGKEAA